MLAGLEHQIGRRGTIVLHEHRPIDHSVDHLPRGIENDRLALDFIHARSRRILRSNTLYTLSSNSIFCKTTTCLLNGFPFSFSRTSNSFTPSSATSPRSRPLATLASPP